jgi:hypothetical protein
MSALSAKLAVLAGAARSRPLRYAVRRHLRLRASAGRSYSQFGEDLVIAKIFHSLRLDPERAFFLDVGAFHPSWNSNTYLFYRRGMSGINVDTAREKILLFEAFRPRDVSLVGAVVGDDGPAEVTLASPPGFSDAASVLDGNPAPTAEEPFFAQFGLRHTRVRTLRMAEVLDRAPRGKRFAYLNIDCEGLDERIVRSIDFERVRPAVLSVEERLPLVDRIEHLRASSIARYLAERGYAFVSQCALTSLYVDARLLETHPELWV